MPLYKKPAAGGSYVYLTHQDAAASANIDIALDDFTGYRNFMIVFENVRPATDGAELFLRVSTDGGTTFDAAASNYEWNYLGLAAAVGVSTGTNADTEIQIAEAMGNVDGEGMSGHLWIFDPHTTTSFTNFTWHVGYFNSASNTTVLTGQGRRHAAQDTTDVRFLMDAGNITSGRFILYGIPLNAAGAPNASDTVPGVAEIATQAEQETGTDLTRIVTPGRQHFHPSASKFWAKAGIAGTASVSYNLTSITDGGVGLMTANIATDFSSANWCATVTIENIDASIDASTDVQIAMIGLAGQAAGTLACICGNASGVAAVDPTQWHVSGLGDFA